MYLMEIYSRYKCVIVVHAKLGDGMNKVYLAGLNLISFMAIGLIQSQVIVLMREMGFNGIYRGWLLGIGAFVSVFLALVFGLWSDSIGKMKPGYMLLIILFGISAYFTLYSEVGVYKGFYLVVSLGLIRQLMSHTENWIFQIEPIRFGQFHIFAAVGLTISSLFAGYMVSRGNGIELAHICILLSLMGCIISVYVSDVDHKGQEVSIGYVKELFSNRAYMKLMLVLLLLMMVGFADQFVVVDKMLELTSDVSSVSWKFAIQSLSEIPLYLFSKRLFERIDAVWLLLVASIASGIKFALYASFDSVFALIGISILQMVSHPLILLSAKILIERITSSALKSTSQMLGYAIYFGVAGFITPIVSSWLVLRIGYDGVLYVFSISVLIPIFIQFRMKNELKYVKLSKEEHEKVI